MRALIFESRPESLEQEGLVVAIEKRAAALETRHAIEVALDVGEEPDVPLEVKEALSRIVQEALHNIVKHAEATRVDIALHCTGGAVMLDIRDDGKGFDTDGDFAGHLGLRSMRERAERLGGQMMVDSRPGSGARISVAVALQAE
jgi:signal transduction histidine kinase